MHIYQHFRQSSADPNKSWNTYFYWMQSGLCMMQGCLNFFTYFITRAPTHRHGLPLLFNLTEAIVESAIIIVFAFTIPVHIIHLLAFLVFMTLYNNLFLFMVILVMNSIISCRSSQTAGWASGFLYFQSAIKTNMHQTVKIFKGNYGLYFYFKDSGIASCAQHIKITISILIG